MLQLNVSVLLRSGLRHPRRNRPQPAAAVPPETEILRQALRIVDNAHRIARDRGINLSDGRRRRAECRRGVDSQLTCYIYTFRGVNLFAVN